MKAFVRRYLEFFLSRTRFFGQPLQLLLSGLDGSVLAGHIEVQGDADRERGRCSQDVKAFAGKHRILGLVL